MQSSPPPTSPSPPSAETQGQDATFGWAPWWVLAFVALWPLTAPAEVVLSVGAIVAIVVLAVRRFRDGARLLTNEAWALTTVLFFSYWLPEFFSAIDAVNALRSLRETGVDLRYLPFLWLVAMAVADARGRRITFIGIAAIVGAWTLDALIEAIAGFSVSFRALQALAGLLSERPMCASLTADRLSGVFNPCNLKLGPVLATLSPFLLIALQRRLGAFGWALAAIALFVVILLAGSRASWVTYALVLVCSAWQVFGRRRVLILVAIGALALGALTVGFSDRLGARFERTAAVLSGDEAGVDRALSGRLPIWRAALVMSADHPINGVGVRGFRHAYRDYARADDQFLALGRQGAFHAHQIVLEVLSETGGLGLLLWLAGVAIALRAWHYASPEARERARTPGLALVVTVFPLNTHLAFYSTFWSGVTLLLAALYAGALMARDAAPEESQSAQSPPTKARPAR